MSNKKILVVEDEIGIAKFLKEGLEEENFIVTTTLRGEDAIELSYEQSFDLILLDWMILGLSGLEVCRHIRASNNINSLTPIIFLTAKDTVQDTIEGLHAGANDYIRKPFSFDELLARIEVQLRSIENPILHLGDIELNSSNYQSWVGGKEIKLTHKEFLLLKLLIENKGNVCTRKQIIEDIWDIHFDYDTSVIDVFMNSIRKKLGMKKEDQRIQTIRGVGYIAHDI